MRKLKYTYKSSLFQIFYVGTIPNISRCDERKVLEINHMSFVTQMNKTTKKHRIFRLQLYLNMVSLAGIGKNCSSSKVFNK